eukprot:39976-Pyramimonas_sp.AAC.1
MGGALGRCFGHSRRAPRRRSYGRGIQTGNCEVDRSPSGQEHPAPRTTLISRPPVVTWPACGGKMTGRLAFRGPCSQVQRGPALASGARVEIVQNYAHAVGHRQRPMPTEFQDIPEAFARRGVAAAEERPVLWLRGLAPSSWTR